MEEATIIGIDLSKNSLQVHGAGAAESVVFRKKLTRTKVLGFFGIATGLRGGDGGVRECSPLGPGDREARSRSEVDLVYGGGTMLHAERPGGPVAAAQKCATCGPLSVAISTAARICAGAAEQGCTKSFGGSLSA